MSEVTVGGDDAYMACSTELPREASHIVRFEPVADMSVVPHMLLYLCTEKPMARRPRPACASAPAPERNNKHSHSRTTRLALRAAQVSQQTGKLNMMHQRCSGSEMLAYGWGRNAPPLALPDGVGFEVGEGGFAYAVLEVRRRRRRARARPRGDAWRLRATSFSALRRCTTCDRRAAPPAARTHPASSCTLPAIRLSRQQ
jgi:hypothetical protein